MAKREFIRREDLTELDRYKVDSGKYVGMRLGDAFDDLAISEQDIVKLYLDRLKEQINSIPIVTRHGVSGTIMTAQGMRKKILDMVDNLLQGDIE